MVAFNEADIRRSIGFKRAITTIQDPDWKPASSSPQRLVVRTFHIAVRAKDATSPCLGLHDDPAPSALVKILAGFAGPAR